MERKQIFPPASPLLVEGIATVCAFVKVPTGVWEHTSLSTPVTEDSKTAAEIWSLGGPQCITLHTLVTPRAGSFPFKCEPESIKPNELRKPGDYLSVYPPRLFHTTSGFTRCRNARGKFLQPNCYTLKKHTEVSNLITIKRTTILSKAKQDVVLNTS